MEPHIWLFLFGDLTQITDNFESGTFEMCSDYVYERAFYKTYAAFLPFLPESYGNLYI